VAVERAIVTFSFRIFHAGGTVQAETRAAGRRGSIL
jgi:hypothetical protein